MELPKRGKQQRVGRDAELAFRRKLNKWVSLQPYDEDPGIDCFGNLMKGENYTSNVCFFQVKGTEEDYKDTSTGFSIPIKKETIELWKDHKPTFLVFVDLRDNDKIYWLHVNPIIDNDYYHIMKKKGNTHTFNIPKENLLLIKDNLSKSFFDIIISTNIIKQNSGLVHCYLDIMELSLNYDQLISDIIKKAKLFLDSKEFIKAKNSYEKLLSQGSKLTEDDWFKCNNNIAACYVNARDYEGALSYLLKCLSVKPNDIKINSNLSQVYLILSEENKRYFTKAREFAKKALERKPNDMLANIVICRLNKEYKPLLPLLDQTKDVGLKAFINHTVSFIKDQLGEKDAIPFSEEALNLESNHYGYNSFLAYLYLKKNNPLENGAFINTVRPKINQEEIEKAIALYNSSIELADKQGALISDTTKRNILGCYYLLFIKNKDFCTKFKEKFLDIYNSIENLDNHSKFLLSSLYGFLGYFRKALEILNQLPNDFPVVTNRISSLLYIAQQKRVIGDTIGIIEFRTKALEEIENNYELLKEDSEIMKQYGFLKDYLGV